MSADALVAWFVRIFDSESLMIVAGQVGEETAARIARGEATVAELYIAAAVLGWGLGDLLPGSIGELYGPPHDFQRRNAECIA